MLFGGEGGGIRKKLNVIIYAVVSLREIERKRERELRLKENWKPPIHWGLEKFVEQRQKKEIENANYR